jgi:hypothetical protein
LGAGELQPQPIQQPDAAQEQSASTFTAKPQCHAIHRLSQRWQILFDDQPDRRQQHTVGLGA